MAALFDHDIRTFIPCLCHPLGIGIIDSIYNKKQKRDRIKAVAEVKLSGEVKKNFMEAVDKLVTACEPRDAIAHGKWSVSASSRFKDVLLWQKKTWTQDGHEVYDRDRLQGIGNGIISARNSLQIMLTAIVPTPGG